MILGFLGAKTRYRAWAKGNVESLEKLKNDAHVKALEDGRQADGRFGKWTPEDRQAFDDAKAKFGTGEDQLAAAENSEGWFSKVTGFSSGDIPAVSKALEDSSDFLKATADIPFVDTWRPQGPRPTSTPRTTSAWCPGGRRLPGRGGRSVPSLAGGTWRAMRPPVP